MFGGLIGLGAKLPAFNPNYSYHLEWLFEDSPPGPCHADDFKTAAEALDAMVGIWNSGKVLVHISLSRRNA